MIGDKVKIEVDGGRNFLSEVMPRKNLLSRTYFRRTKNLAANLDCLLIVTAVLPLFNTTFVDRILTSAYHENIKCVLLLNKTDLGIEQTQDLVDVYRRLGLDLILTSTKSTGGLRALESYLHRQELQVAALAGVSGVGKSSILNRLVPHAKRNTREVSQKTGQGRQTTSQSHGYLYEQSSDKNLLLIDLPGIQNYGVTHLDVQQIKEGMTDIAELAAGCEYSDCMHTAEPNCAVKRALDDASLAASRYNSYLQMLDEIESAREY